MTTTFFEMKFGITEFHYLEMLSILDYLEIYKPHIDGIQTRTQSVDNRMGVFMSVL